MWAAHHAVPRPFRRRQALRGPRDRQERNLSNARFTHFYDGDTFPLASDSYAAVLCSQVLEHSLSPEELLSECHRVLRPGGSLLLTVPFLWPEHEQPWDAQRFTSFGLRQRLEAAGFRVETMVRLNPGLSALLQLLIEWNESRERRLCARLPKGLPRSGLKLLWRLWMALPYSALNLLGLLARSISSRKSMNPEPSASGGPWGAELYLDLVMLAVKSDPQDTQALRLG